MGRQSGRRGLQGEEPVLRDLLDRMESDLRLLEGTVSVLQGLSETSDAVEPVASRPSPTSPARRSSASRHGGARHAVYCAGAEPTVAVFPRAPGSLSLTINSVPRSASRCTSIRWTSMAKEALVVS